MSEQLELQLDRRVTAFDLTRRVADRRFQGQLSGRWTWLEAEPFVAARGRVVLHAEPDDSSVQVTEALLGEGVELLEERPGGWAWVRTAHDGYLGYAQRSELTEPVDQPTALVTALRGHLFSRPHISGEVLDVVGYGMHLGLLDAPPLEANGREWWRTTYRGRDAYVHAAVVAPIEGSRIKNLDWIQRFLETPYLWGGRSAWGIDCSGLAGLFHGFAIPRDADQQRAACQRVERPEPGDLAFFPGHVGIMLDARRLLHANASQMRVSVDVLGEGAAGQRLADDLIEFGHFDGVGA